MANENGTRGDNSTATFVEDDGKTGADKGGGGSVDPADFDFPHDSARGVYAAALRRRRAIRNQSQFELTDPDFLAEVDLDAEWVGYADEVYGFKFRTHLAAVLCALLARATDADVDPASLQVGSGDYGYSASRLWRDVILPASQDQLSLKRLKDQPFNNSPYNGKKRVATDWENVKGNNKQQLERTAELIEKISAMTPEEAGRALTSFITAAENPPEREAVRIDATDLQALDVSLTDVASVCDDFIAMNSDDGRRAQAFVAACLEAAFPGRITTPASVHDPSRNSPGDVKSHELDDPRNVGPLFVEVKDRIVHRADVVQFIREVGKFDNLACVGYAALANDDDAQRSLPDKEKVPTGEMLTGEFGVPVIVWRSPLDLLAYSALASMTAMPVFLARFAVNYLRWLDHIDTGKHQSPELWARQLRAWGLLDDPDAPTNSTDEESRPAFKTWAHQSSASDP